MYKEEAFSKAAKNDIYQMIENIKIAFQEMFKALTSGRLPVYFRSSVWRFYQETYFRTSKEQYEQIDMDGFSIKNSCFGEISKNEIQNWISKLLR